MTHLVSITDRYRDQSAYNKQADGWVIHLLLIALFDTACAENVVIVFFFFKSPATLADLTSITCDETIRVMKRCFQRVNVESETPVQYPEPPQYMTTEL